MSKIIMMKGLPGSGKSTLAKEWISNAQKMKRKVKRINKDDLRAMIHDSEWSGKLEGDIILARDALVTLFIQHGYDVIVDDTNLDPKHEKRLRELAYQLGADFGISFVNTPLEECIMRDDLRGNPGRVGRGVIMQMYNRYLKPRPIEHNPELPDSIIVDLDGTLATWENGSPYDRDFSKDKLVTQVKSVLDKFAKDCDIFIFSGRQNKTRKVTEIWLEENGMGLGYYSRLSMRQDGDNRSDEIIKKEFYDDCIKDKYNVKFVIDDRPKVIRMWRSIGLFVFDVNQTGVEF